MIYGIGIDTVEVERIKESILRTASFCERVFAESEIKYCKESIEPLAYQRFAARFAAKEAFLKAFGTGLREGFALSEIAVLKDNLGKPSIELSGKSLDTYRKAVTEGKIHLSLTHTDSTAQAIVIIENQIQ